MQVLKTVNNNDSPLIGFWRWPAGCQRALSVTEDIDALTIVDFISGKVWKNQKEK